MMYFMFLLPMYNHNIECGFIRHFMTLLLILIVVCYRLSYTYYYSDPY